MNALLAASAAFFLLHMLPATPLRPRLIALAGEWIDHGDLRGCFAGRDLVAGLLVQCRARLALSFGRCPPRGRC